MPCRAWIKSCLRRPVCWTPDAAWATAWPRCTAVWPQARLHGVEWSPLLARLAAWRCQGAHIRRGDMWAMSWAGHDLVYLFQRPESMARAWAKASSEMRAGAHLVSLEFAVPDLAGPGLPAGPGRRPVWVYAMPALG
jgi:hypothetical protein